VTVILLAAILSVIWPRLETVWGLTAGGAVGIGNLWAFVFAQQHSLQDLNSVLSVAIIAPAIGIAGAAVGTYFRELQD
jgi:hypothetical protein